MPPLNEVGDEVPLLVRDKHPSPLVRLQSQRPQGEVLEEVISRVAALTHIAGLVGFPSSGYLVYL